MSGDQRYQDEATIAKINVSNYLRIGGKFNFFHGWESTDEDNKNRETNTQNGISFYIKPTSNNASKDPVYSFPTLPFSEYGIDDFVKDCRILGVDIHKPVDHFVIRSDELRKLAKAGVKFGEFHDDLCAALGGIEQARKSFTERG